jgi:hypothetical protein
MDNNNILNHQIEEPIEDLFNDSMNNKFVNSNTNNNYKYLKYLGNSTSNNLFGKGEIHLVKNNNIRKKILCKIIDLNDIDNKELFKKKLNKELKLYNFIKNNPATIKCINSCLYKEYLDNMIYLYFNNKIGLDLTQFNFKKQNKSFIYKLIKKILLGLKSLHTIDIPHQNLEENSIIIYKNKNNIQIKFTNFLVDNYKIKTLTKKKKKKNYQITLKKDLEYLKKKDIKQLGKILLELFNKTNNSFNLITFFSGDENKENYQNIIKTKMLCEDNYITDLNDILRQFIYYDKYGY